MEALMWLILGIVFAGVVFDTYLLDWILGID